jgi:hypothetical protein
MRENGKRRETKQETKPFPGSGNAVLQGKTAMQGNRQETTYGNDGH